MFVLSAMVMDTSPEREQVRAALRHAISMIGSQQRLAEMVGRRQQQISYALKVGRVNPIVAFRIVKAVNGLIPVESFCPELRNGLHN